MITARVTPYNTVSSNGMDYTSGETLELDEGVATSLARLGYIEITGMKPARLRALPKTSESLPPRIELDHQREQMIKDVEELYLREEFDLEEFERRITDIFNKTEPKPF